MSGLNSAQRDRICAFDYKSSLQHPVYVVRPLAEISIAKAMYLGMTFGARAVAQQCCLIRFCIVEGRFFI